MLRVMACAGGLRLLFYLDKMLTVAVILGEMLGRYLNRLFRRFWN